MLSGSATWSEGMGQGQESQFLPGAASHGVCGPTPAPSTEEQGPASSIFPHHTQRTPWVPAGHWVWDL